MLVIGSDVWTDGAEEAARRLAETAGIPVITNGMGRGILPAGHPLLVTRARGAAFGGADLVVVVGVPLDFRLGFGVFGGKEGAAPAPVVHLADSPGQLATHVELAGSAAGDLSAVLDGVLDGWTRAGRPGGVRPVDLEPAGRRRARPSTRTGTSWPATPTRSTRRASTASWAAGSRTTPW